MDISELQQNQNKGICLIYLRVSTDRQAEKGIALPTQQDSCFKHAEKLGYVFNEKTDVYIDGGETGRNTDRAQLQEMLLRCEKDKNVKALVIYDVSRLSRNRIDFALIKRDLNKWNIKLISATENIDNSPEGQLLEGVVTSVAEYFSAQHGRRVKSNLKQKARDGWWPTQAPFGYKNVQEKVSTGKVKAWIEINWNEAKWVQRAYELYATGNWSVRDMAEQLEAEGFPVRPFKGRAMSLNASYVEHLLHDNFYIGTIEWDGVVNAEARHELFLDRGLFEKVQAVLKSRTGSTSRQRRLFSIIKSVSYCDECNSKMTSEEQGKKGGKQFRYLRCSKRQHHKKVICQQKYFHESEYENRFFGLLQNLRLPREAAETLRGKIRALFSDEHALYEHSRKSILEQIDGIKRRKKNLVLQLVDKEQNSAADIDIYNSVKVDLEIEEKRLNDELGKVESKIAGVVRTVEIVISLAVSCAYAFENAKEPQLKALLARTLFQKLYMRDGQIVRAVLHAPMDYFCQEQTQRDSVFEQDMTGGTSPPLSNKSYPKQLILTTRRRS